jgi:uncharacterized protein (DUF58 family)
MSTAIPYITVSLDELNQQEHQFHHYALLAKKNIYSILAGRHSSKLRGRGLDFEEVRKYVPGDDVRNIDWNVTARTRTTYTKIFNEEKERPNFAIVDQSSHMFFGSKKYTKSYIGAMLSAVAGFKVLKTGDRFGGVIFNEDRIDHIPSKRSRKNLQHFFKHLVSYNEDLLTKQSKVSEGNRLNEVLFKVSGTIGHDYVIVVISDFLQANDETFKHLLNLSKHNDVICACILDPLETDLPSQKILLTDGERQMLWNKKLANKSELSAHMKDTQKRFQENLLKYGIVSLSFNTTEDVPAQMKRIINKVMRR